MDIKLYVPSEASGWLLTSGFVDDHVTLLGSKKDQQCPLMAALLPYTSDALYWRQGTEQEKRREILRLSETACALPVTRLPTGEQNIVLVQNYS